MISLQRTVPAVLAGAVGAAARAAFPAAASALPPSVCGVTQSKKGLPGDYQTSAAMALARAVKRAPEPVAQELCAAVAAEAAAAGCPLVAAPSKNGFVNLTLDDGWLAAQVAHVAAGGLAPPQSPSARRRVLVDYASPNMGKELHPGHLRSAVIGDSLARALEASGWDVDRVSHVGDAGLPVAIVLAWYLQQPELRLAALSVLCGATSDDDGGGAAWTLPSATLAAIRGGAVPLPSPRELSQAYERGKRLMAMAAAAAKAEGAAAAAAADTGSDDSGPAVAAPASPKAAPPPPPPPPAEHVETARTFTALVQSTLRQLQSVLGRMGEWEALAASATASGTAAAAAVPPLYTAWVGVCEASRRGYLPLFASLGVATTERGESAYVGDLPALVDSLLASGAAKVSHDAVVLFVDGRDAPPLLVRKGDGGFLYATVDLAALRRRLAAGYDRLVYVTDAAQAHHFRQLFAAARALGWVTPDGCNALHPTRPGHAPVSLEHAAFGVVQGPTGRKLSSRDGTEATLAGLLEDARAAAVRAAGEREAERARERARLRALPGWSDGGNDGEAAPTAAAAAAAAAPDGTGTVPPPALSPRLAAAIAHSAVRYHDLCHAAASNYRLSFDAALALRGNTAPYLMYALTRLAAIRRQAAKVLEAAGIALPPPPPAHGGDAPAAGSAAAACGEDDDDAADAGELAASGPGWDQLTAAVEALLQARGHVHPPSPAAPRLHASERVLAVSVLRLPEAMAGCLSALSPHVLAEHMFALASDFHSFYEACRVLQLPSSPAGGAAAATAAGGAAADAEAQLLRQSLLRLRLCAATDAALRTGCHVLGVRLIQRM